MTFLVSVMFDLYDLYAANLCEVFLGSAMTYRLSKVRWGMRSSVVGVTTVVSLLDRYALIGGSLTAFEIVLEAV